MEETIGGLLSRPVPPELIVTSGSKPGFAGDDTWLGHPYWDAILRISILFRVTQFPTYLFFNTEYEYRV